MALTASVGTTPEAAMHYEEALRQVGEFGPYQKLIFYLGCAFSFGGCLCNFTYVFIAFLPDHHCRVPAPEGANWTLRDIETLALPPAEVGKPYNYSRCFMYDRPYGNLTMMTNVSTWGLNGTPPVVTCQHGWEYDTSMFTSTVAMDWDLTCDNKFLAAISQSVYMAGLMAGVLLCGIVADIIGRQKTIIVCVCMNVASFALTAASANYAMFLCLRFATAFSEMSLFTIFMVHIMECVGTEWRAYVGIVNEYFWVLGYGYLVLVAYLVPSWRHLQACLAVPFIIYIPILFVLPESPRWLYMKGKDRAGDKLLKKFAKYNKRKFPDGLRIQMEHSTAQVYIWEAFRYPRLRIRILIIYFVWFVSSLVYYGLSLNSGQLGGSLYLSFVLAGAIELPAYILCHVLSDRLGRRFITGISLLLGGVALLTTMAVPQDPAYNWMMIALSTTGKFGVSATFAIIHVYTVELFPTVARTSGIGTSSFFARLGGVFAPQVALLNEFSKYIPLVLFGVLSCLAGIATFFLPETCNTAMPGTLQEAETFVNESAKIIPGWNTYKPSKGHEEIDPLTTGV